MPPGPPAQSCPAAAAGAARAGRHVPAPPGGSAATSHKPSAWAMAAMTRAGSLTGASDTKQAPSAKSARNDACDLQGQARFADAPGAGNGEQTHLWTREQLADRPHLLFATDQGREVAPGSWQAMVASEPLRVAQVLLWLAADASSPGRKPQRTVWFLLSGLARRASSPSLPCSPAPLPPTAAARA